MRKTGNFVFILVGGIFFIVGLGLLMGGIFAGISSREIAKESEIIVGEITDIHVHYDSDGDANHDVFVQYEYEGREYDVELNSYSSSMYEGKEIELYVRPDAPGDARAVSTANLAGYILMGMGGVFAVIGFMVLLTGLKSLFRNSSKKLKKNGKQIYATVTNAYLNMSTSINGRSPYWLECQYEDPYTGNKYLFRSGNLWEIPDPYIGQQVIVYVDMKDWSRYSVDLESLQKKYGAVYDYR